MSTPPENMACEWVGGREGGREEEAFTTVPPPSSLQASPHLEAVGEGREVEVVLVKYLSETLAVGGVVDLLGVGPHLVVSTGYGILHRLSWEGTFYSSLAINLNHVPFATDLLPESRGRHLNMSVIQALPGTDALAWSGWD